MTTRYERTPSPALMALLDGLLRPMRTPRVVHGLPLDLQLREKDEVSLYCGMTCLVSARRSGGLVRLKASPTYMRQDPGFFRVWRPDEDLGTALEAYLARVQVDDRWLRKEGTVQAAWMQLEAPWVTVDREAVIGGGTEVVAASQAAFEAVDALAVESGWGRPDAPKAGNELDQLALDPDGRLVLAELKHASSSVIQYAPLQALRYVWEWHAALPIVHADLVALIAARRELGLMPPGPALGTALRPVVAWGVGTPSAERLRRLDLVLPVVERHLPPGVDRIEVWSLPDGVPKPRS